MKILDSRNFIYLFIFPLIFAIRVDAQIISNEQAVILAAKSGIETAFSNDNFKAVQIKVAENEISRPVAIGIAEGFDLLNITVVGNDGAESDVKRIECDILGFDFKYLNGGSRGFLRSKMLKRKFTAFLKITIIDSDMMSVSVIKDITINYEDQIDPELSDLVKSRTIHALSPSFPSSGLKRIIEPVIITAAIGSMTYLFFANR